MMLRRSDSETNHYEHVSLRQELNKLDSALAALVCYSEVYADLGSIEQVRAWVRRLHEDVPSHFAHEEQQVLAPVASLGPEWQAFVSEMRRQHLDLQQQLEAVCAVAERVRDSDDLESSICKLKEQGEQVTRQMASHMGAEDRKLSTMEL